MAAPERSKTPVQKPYHSPVVTEFGAIAQLTQANPVTGGAADGTNQGTPHKTQ